MNFIKSALSGLPQFAMKQFAINLIVDGVGQFAPGIAAIFTNPVSAIRKLIGK